MKVYKYYPLQFDAALKAGFVYINTFENIRRIESSNLIGDMNEATATNSVDISFDPSDPLMASAATNATYGMMDFTRFNAMGVFITNSSFTATLPDAYMYCVTSERNDEFWAETCGYGINGSVQRIDTHAAMVFLAGDRVYKIKRAVRFPYLDYSTRDKRHQACLNEIAVNIDNAPEIYLGVVAIVIDETGGLRISREERPPGQAVEWASRCAGSTKRRPSTRLRIMDQSRHLSLTRWPTQ